MCDLWIDFLLLKTQKTWICLLSFNWSIIKSPQFFISSSNSTKSFSKPFRANIIKESTRMRKTFCWSHKNFTGVAFEARDAWVGSKLGRISPKWDKSGTSLSKISFSAFWLATLTSLLEATTMELRGCQIWAQIGPDWHQMDKFWTWRTIFN